MKLWLIILNWSSQAARDFQRTRLRGAVGGGAEQSWFTGADNVQRGRHGRLAEASHFVPTPIWLLLIAAGLVLIGYVFLFADARERRLAQWMMITAVTSAVAASLLMVAYLNQPYGHHEGALEPTAMSDVLQTMERQRGSGSAARCDATGMPVGGILRDVSG